MRLQRRPRQAQKRPPLRPAAASCFHMYTAAARRTTRAKRRPSAPAPSSTGGQLTRPLQRRPLGRLPLRQRMLRPLHRLLPFLLQRVMRQLPKHTTLLLLRVPRNPPLAARTPRSVLHALNLLLQRQTLRPLTRERTLCL